MLCYSYFIDYIEEVCGLDEYKSEGLALVVTKLSSRGLDIVGSLYHIDGQGSNLDGLV